MVSIARIPANRANLAALYLPAGVYDTVLRIGAAGCGVDIGTYGTGRSVSRLDIHVCRDPRSFQFSLTHRNMGAEVHDARSYDIDRCGSTLSIQTKKQVNERHQ